MIGALIVAATELRRTPAQRAYHRKLEADRIEHMWEDMAIDGWLGQQAQELRRRRDGLPHKQLKPNRQFHRSRKSSLSGGFPW